MHHGRLSYLIVFIKMLIFGCLDSWLRNPIPVSLSPRCFLWLRNYRNMMSWLVVGLISWALRGWKEVPPHWFLLLLCNLVIRIVFCYWFNIFFPMVLSCLKVPNMLQITAFIKVAFLFCFKFGWEICLKSKINLLKGTTTISNRTKFAN